MNGVLFAYKVFFIFFLKENYSGETKICPVVVCGCVLDRTGMAHNKQWCCHLTAPGSLVQPRIWFTVCACCLHLGVLWVLQVPLTC